MSLRLDVLIHALDRHVYFHNGTKAHYPRLPDVYAALGSRYSYFAIQTVLERIAPPTHLALLMVRRETSELLPTEIFDEFLLWWREHGSQVDFAQAVEEAYDDFAQKLGP